MEQKTNQATNVIFYMEKPEGNLSCDCFAYFPNERYNSIENDIFTGYAHIGQHNSCCSEWKSNRDRNPS